MRRLARVQSGNAYALGEVDRPLKAHLKCNVTNSACELVRRDGAAGKERREESSVYQ
jgi:hypothetical protein